ncbi:von Willebrand factor A domain-containing protein 5A isoform X3 [Camelus bactrianus]|uniref:von Willebrand factor A domain-containing protein 5A isoform X3 n=1 Tax=Camelus bactrianus TaxID=9837 RepID=A0AC58PTE0_CAMBA
MVCPCGLLTRQEEPVPLKSISVTLSICEFVAGVSATLNYENEEKVPLEAFFVFPMDEDSAVYSFEAMVDGSIIKAELQDKTEAHANYENAISQGHQAFLLEEDDCSRDVFFCNVGNLRPGSKVALTLKYVQELPLEADGALRYVLPAILNPRYQLSDSLLGDPVAMVSFYPNIPEAQPSAACGEFVFLMDRSGSMQSPMSNQNKSQPRIEAAKETLILILKSLPIGCYFNIYGFGSSYEAFFPKSVKYDQCTMEEALRRVKLMRADLGGTEMLAPLQAIYGGPSIPGHPLQLFVFTDGEVSDTFRVIKEVESNGQKHRCFSFGIGEGASTSLIKGIARVSQGASEFITGRERMQSKALRALKHSLQPVVEDVSLSWDLPQGLSAKMLSPEQTVIFKGQRLIVYAQLTGMMLPAESTGGVCLKYALQGKSFENKVAFSLQPKHDANLTIHRLAAKSFLQTKDMGFRETPASDKKDVLKVSIECGVISSYTAFIAINKDLNKPVQGPLVRRDIPRPFIFCAASMPRLRGGGAPLEASSCPDVLQPRMSTHYLGPDKPHALGHKKKKEGVFLQKTCLMMDRPHPPTNRTNLEIHQPGEMGLSSILWPMGTEELIFNALLSSGFLCPGGDLFEKHQAEVFEDNHLVQLISLQKADGSWDLNEGLALVLGMKLEDIQAALPLKNADSSSWATVLAVLWLHANGKPMKCEWELLERKAVAWIHLHAGSARQVLVQAAITFLKSPVDPAVFAL